MELDYVVLAEREAGTDLVVYDDLAAQKGGLIDADEVEAKIAEYSAITDPTEYDKRVLNDYLAQKRAVEAVRVEDKVIDLASTIARSFRPRDHDNYSSRDFLDWPGLAVAPATLAGKTQKVRIDSDGRVTFRKTVTLPPGTDPQPPTGGGATNRTLTPMIPPSLRSKVEPNHLILWEATWSRVAKHRPPGDPALIEPIGEGYLYRVVVEWELTPTEQRCMIPV